MDVAVISILSGSFWRKTSFLGHCIAEIWHKIVAEIYWKLYHYLYTKWTENFPVPRQLNLRISQYPLDHFLPNKGHFTRNWTANHMITLS